MRLGREISMRIMLLVLLLLIAGCSQETPSVPEGYGFTEYAVAEVTNVSCSTYKDCETPGTYLILSSCPYTSLCLDGKCTVVCPGYEQNS